MIKVLFFIICIISLYLVISLMGDSVEKYVWLVMQSKFFFFYFSIKIVGIEIEAFYSDEVLKSVMYK